MHTALLLLYIIIRCHFCDEREEQKAFSFPITSKISKKSTFENAFSMSGNKKEEKENEQHTEETKKEDKDLMTQTREKYTRK